MRGLGGRQPRSRKYAAQGSQSQPQLAWYPEDVEGADDAPHNVAPRIDALLFDL
jgi:hypothetical protein